jgi:hypothetical protein
MLMFSENLLGHHRTPQLEDQNLRTVGGSRLTDNTSQTDVYKRQTDGRMNLVTTSGLSFLLRTVRLKILKVWRNYHQRVQLIKKTLRPQGKSY